MVNWVQLDWNTEKGRREIDKIIVRYLGWTEKEHIHISKCCPQETRTVISLTSPTGDRSIPKYTEDIYAALKLAYQFKIILQPNHDEDEFKWSAATFDYPLWPCMIMEKTSMAEHDNPSVAICQSFLKLMESKNETA